MPTAPAAAAALRRFAASSSFRRRRWRWRSVRMKLPKPSVVRAVFRTFRSTVFLTGAVNLFVQFCQIAVPLCVAALLEWFAGGEGSVGSSVGIAFFMLFLSVVGQGLVQTHNFMRLFKAGMDLRTILCTRIYEKALTISNAERARMSTGEIVNLMSADSEKMVFTCILFHGLWTTPIFLAVAIYLLVRLVGVAILPGLALLILSSPFQLMLIIKQKKRPHRENGRSGAAVLAE